MRIQGLIVSVVVLVGVGCGSGQQDQTCGGQRLPATFEAERAQLQGVQVSSEGRGFSGTGYVTGFTQPGSQVTFDVCAPQQGYYTADFTYAKGTDGVGTRTLVIDGKTFPGQPVFEPLWTWDMWSDGGRRSFHLDPGKHTVAIAFQQADSGEIRLDKLTFSSGPNASHESVRALLMNKLKVVIA